MINAMTRRGIALPAVLGVLTLLLIILSTVAYQGIGSLNVAKVSQATRQSLFAAEAGVSDGLRQLVEDPTLTGPLADGTLENGAVYTVEIFNNIDGTGPPVASNDAAVPAGFAYILATGSRSDGAFQRSAGALVHPSAAAAFGMAMGSGGDIRMQGSKTVKGTIKASGDLRVQGSTTIEPMNGNGRLLAGGELRSQGNTTLDSAQEARARAQVNASPAIRGAYLVQPNDTSPATLPFIADGRTTNVLNTGEQGLILPNPDQAALLDATNPDLVTWSVTNFSGTLDLTDKIHYFPDGVSFSPTTNFVGSGTIVVGNGNAMEFQGSTTINANLIALRRPDQMPSGGNPSIRFQGSTTVNGLIYAHEDIQAQGSFTLNGVMIAYHDGGAEIRTQGNSNITLDSGVLGGIPGFEPWANGFGSGGSVPAGATPMAIASWERF
ncbi:MAG: hypothetical protein AB7S38_23840 [Vulcanimicrobiota bacterium]